MQGEFIVWSQKIWNLIGQYKSRENGERIYWYSNTKTDSYSSCYLFLSLSGQVIYFHETDSYCIILSHYLQLSAEVLQNRCSQKLFTIHRKPPVSKFLFNQLVAFQFFNKSLWHRCFLVNFVKLSRIPVLQTILGILLLYLLKIL